MSALLCKLNRQISRSEVVFEGTAEECRNHARKILSQHGIRVSNRETGWKISDDIRLDIIEEADWVFEKDDEEHDYASDGDLPEFYARECIGL